MRKIGDHAKVAKLCKEYLKAKGLRCKATSSSYSMGNSVHVLVYDQPPEVIKEIEAHLKQYQQGHFNGMEDIYEYSNTRKDIPQTKYLSIENERSDELRAAAYEYLRKHWHGGELLPPTYAEAGYNHNLSGEQVSTMMHRLLSGALDTASAKFWESRKPKATEKKPIGNVLIEEHTHTKHGFQMYIVIPPRVEREEFDRLLSLAREAGGWYSRKWGTTPGGFAFKVKEAAQTFAQHITAEAATPEKQAAPIVSNRAEKFRAIAEKMTPVINSKFADRLTNTHKRLAQAAHARREGERLQRTQKLLLALAGLYERNNVPSLLAGISSKADAYAIMAAESQDVPNGYHSYKVDSDTPYHKTPEALAAWALLEGKTPEETKAEEIRRKIDGLQFSNIPGYFPTPAPVIALMLEHADVQSGDKVLEPELGSGAIADAVRPLCAEVKGYEKNYTLSEIVEAKGYLIECRDFLTVPQEESPLYDKVLMNPPFETGQDIDHVRHAFQFLKATGRLVAIMSAGVRFNSTGKFSAFREWAKTKGGKFYELPPGAFKESGTGVNALLFVVHA